MKKDDKSKLTEYQTEYYDPKKWLGFFSIISGVLVIAVMLVAFLVDPFMQYRVRDERYLLNGRFVSAGLIKNYDYDTLLIGSSMAQNFDMDYFSEELNCNPLKIGIGGMQAVEMEELLDLSRQIGKTSNYYICVDLAILEKEIQTSHNSQPLLKKDMLSQAKYLLGYETLMRFMPVDLGLAMYLKTSDNISDKLRYSIGIRKLEDCRFDYDFSRDSCLSTYSPISIGISAVDADGLYERLTNNMDELLSHVDFENSNCTFFFPPYSALFWCCADSLGYLEDYLRAKEYFVEKVITNGGTIYDFQSKQETMDLDNYRDITHYSPMINDQMTDSFTSGEYKVDVQKELIIQGELRDNIKRFYEENQDLFITDF